MAPTSAASIISDAPSQWRPFDQLEPGWRAELSDETSKPYFRSLLGFLDAELRAGRTIYPPAEDVFTAFNLCPLDQVKVTYSVLMTPTPHCYSYSSMCNYSAHPTAPPTLSSLSSGGGDRTRSVPRSRTSTRTGLQCGLRSSGTPFTEEHDPGGKGDEEMMYAALCVVDNWEEGREEECVKHDVSSSTIDRMIQS
jgi:hypothetical protein